MFGKKKPKISIVKVLHPDEKPQISNLGQRLEQICWEYCDQEESRGRIVTTAEMVGIIELLKQRFSP